MFLFGLLALSLRWLLLDAPPTFVVPAAFISTRSLFILLRFFFFAASSLTKFFRNLIVSLTDLFDNSILHQFTLFLTLLIFLFSLFPFFFLRFLFRTGRLIQCSQINLTTYINFRFKFSRTNFKYIVLLLFPERVLLLGVSFSISFTWGVFSSVFSIFRLFLLFQNWSRSRLRSRFPVSFPLPPQASAFPSGAGEFPSSQPPFPPRVLLSEFVQ